MKRAAFSNLTSGVKFLEFFFRQSVRFKGQPLEIIVRRCLTAL